ncbi:MAG: histidine utilization protein HutD, partial [Burkholderiales bacterium PBB5]
MTLHRVELETTSPQPWRNGGGTTHELLAWPPGAPAWLVRVSVARIAAA